MCLDVADCVPLLRGMTPTQTASVNGVNVPELFKTISEVKKTPGIAKFKFRIHNDWVDGPLNRSTISGYHGALQDFERPKQFYFEADEPPVLLGQDRAANPVEYLLHALAACVTTSLVYHAAAKGIEIKSVESELDGDIDLRGFLGLDKNIRNGYQGIRIKLRIDSDVPDAQFDELVRLGPTFSPVFDSISKGVPLTVTGERA